MKARRAALAAVTLTLLSGLLVGLGAAPASADTRVYPVPTSNAGLGRIVTAPNGNMWFTEARTNKVGMITPAGVITEYDLLAQTTAGSTVESIDVGPDGAVWVVFDSGWQALRYLPATDQVETFDLFGDPNGGQIRAAADGSAWVTMNYSDSGIIRLEPGRSPRWLLNAPECDDTLGVGSDGAPWCGAGSSSIVRVAPDTNSGATFPLPGDMGQTTSGLVAGPVGSIWLTRHDPESWYTPANEGAIGYVDAANGAVKYWQLGFNTAPRSPVRGPDNAVWFIGGGTTRSIGHINAEGVGVVSSVGNHQPTSMTFGLDGAVWFTDATNNSIVRISAEDLQTHNVDLGAGSTMTIPATTPPVTPPTVTPVTPAQRVGSVAKSRKPVIVKKGVVPVRIACPAGADCTGRVQLRSAKGKVLTKQRNYTVSAGRTAKVRVSVTKKAMKLLPRGRAVKVKVLLSPAGSGKPTVTRTITVRRR